MYQNEQGQSVRECVRCAYQDVMTDQGPQQVAPAELVTRVNQPRPGEQSLAHEDDVQIVNVVDRGAGSKRRDH